MKLPTICLLSTFLLSGLLQGATKTWASLVDSTWNTGTNWSPSGVPASGDTLIFPNTGSIGFAMTNDLPGSTIVQLLRFDRGGYSLSGSAVRLGPASSDGITLQGGFTTVVTINSPIQLEDIQRFVHLQAGQFIFGNQVSLGSHGLIFSGPLNAIWEFGPGSSLSGSGSIGVMGQGSLRLKTANPLYTGNITVTDGNLFVENAGALGPGGVTNIRKSTTSADGDVLLLGSTPLNVVENFDLENGTSLRAASAAHKVSGSVVLGSGASVCSLGTSFNGSLEIAGVISGSGSLSANQLTSSPGALGKLILSGSSANTYSGTTTVLTGELHLGKNAGVNAVPANLTIGSVFVGFPPCTAKLLNNQQIPDNGTVNVGKMGTFDLNGRNETIGSLSLNDCEIVMGAGKLTLNSGLSTNTSAALGSFVRGTELILTATTSTWTVNAGTTATALTVESKVSSTGTLSRSSGTGNVVFSGETDLAAVTLATNSVTYFNGPVSNPASRGTVTVRANATLAGSGQTGNILCNNASTSRIMPGGPGGRVLDCGSVTFNNSSRLMLDVGVSGQDRLDANGTVALGNAVLELTLEPEFSATYPQSFTIISNDGSDAVGGTFAGLPEGAVFERDGRNFIITYQGGDGNDVVLGGVPPVFDISTAPGETTEGGSIDFTVTMSGETDADITLQYTTVAGSAGAPGDFIAKSGQLVFGSGHPFSQTITIQTVDDNEFEGTETFQVILSNLGGGLPGTTAATASIADNDNPPDPVPGFRVVETTLVAGDGVTPPSLSGSLKGGPPNGVAAAEISSDLGVTDPWTPIDCVAFDPNGEAAFVNLAAPADRIGASRLFFRFRVADILLDHYDDDGGFHPTDNSTAASTINFGQFSTFHLRSAVSFTVPPGGSRRFVSLMAPITEQTTMGPNLRITLRADAGGNPGGLVEVLAENEPLPAFANPFTSSTRFCSPTFPVLSAGSIYWIVCEPVVAASASQDSDYRWFLNQTPGRTVIYKQQQSSGSDLPANPWPAGSFTANLALKIETLSVP